MSWNRHIFIPDDAPVLTTRLNAEFDAAKAAIEAAGGGGLFNEWAFTGRWAGSADVLPQEPSSPALEIILPVGFQWLQDGQLFVVTADDGEQILGPLPANFSGYVSLQVLVEGEAVSWSITTATVRPSLGTGVVAYVETDADGVTLLNATEAKSDVVPPLPALLERLRLLEATAGGGGGGGGGGSTSYWGALHRTGSDATTILQAIDAAIATYAATQSTTGGVTLPQPQRDEVAVNMLENRYLHMLATPNISTLAPMFRGFVFSPGLDNWEDIVDQAKTTVYLDEVNHTIG